MEFLRTAYRFKPLRTFAQSLGSMLVADGTGLLDTDWTAKLNVSGMAALVAFIMIVAEGGSMLGDDKRVTQSAAEVDDGGTVEIGGQRMTEAQFNAARMPAGEIAPSDTKDGS